VTIADEFRADAGRFFDPDYFPTETIQYRAQGGVARDLVAVIDRAEQLQVSIYDDGATVPRTATVWIRTRPAGSAGDSWDRDTGIESPREGDELEFDGFTWRVRGQPKDDGFGSCKLDVVSHRTRERSARQYRLDR